MRIILAIALIVAITAPAAAQYGASGSAASISGYSPPSSQKAKSNKAKAATAHAQEYRRSPYSSNPEYDVYVNGEYVGSDPDPRIRATLAQEWRGRWGLR